MSSKNSQLVSKHVRNYVQAVFSERMQEAGFISPDGKGICWYRIQNTDIINTIFFFTVWNIIPVHVEIGYGIHPFFAQSFYAGNAYVPDRPIDFERFFEQVLLENCPINAMMYTPFSPEAQVYAPGRYGKGIYTFDHIILPKMDKIKTISDCYLMHKQEYLSFTQYDIPTRFNPISSTFIDEAIYVDDVEVYPYCKTSLEKSINALNSLHERYPQKRIYQEELNHCELQRQALFDNNRDEYLKTLELWKKKNIQMLRKKFGIIV